MTLIGRMLKKLGRAVFKSIGMIKQTADGLSEGAKHETLFQYVGRKSTSIMLMVARELVANIPPLFINEGMRQEIMDRLSSLATQLWFQTDPVF